MTYRFSPSRKLVYWHTPKCAGTSIVTEGEFQSDPNWQKVYGARVLRNPLGFHNSVMRKELDLSGFREFATVRNPYGRFVSAYAYCKHNRSFMQNAGYDGLSFQDFQRMIIGGKAEDKPDRVGPWYWIYFHLLIPQVYFVCNADKQPFCDVVKFESLPQGVLRYGLKMAEQRKVRRGGSDLTLMPQTKQFIADQFADDFEVFGYSI